MNLIDLNILPERYRPRKFGFRRLRPWLLVIGYALILIPSVQLLSQAWVNMIPIEQEFRETQAALADFREVSQERQALQVHYEELVSQTSQIETDYQSATIQQVSWGPTLKTTVSLLPGGVRLTSLSQSVGEITLEGEADAYLLPLEYADRLKQTGLFSDVIVEAIRQMPPPRATDASTAQEETEQGFEFEIRVLLDEAVSP
jgi:Tfp pilus assembly protein PilN